MLCMFFLAQLSFLPDFSVTPLAVVSCSTVLVTSSLAPAQLATRTRRLAVLRSSPLIAIVLLAYVCLLEEKGAVMGCATAAR